jgi:hypothetical protein
MVVIFHEIMRRIAMIDPILSGIEVSGRGNDHEREARPEAGVAGDGNSA